MTDAATISRRDLAIGTLIAAIMATVFVALSSGRSLLVTFVPGAFVTWALFVYLHVRRWQVPEPARFLPWYLGTLAFQFLHFTEEFATGFQDRFGLIYGGAPLTNPVFVANNMFAYALFLLSTVGLFFFRRTFLFVPSLFFIVYGAMGNAVTHAFWAVARQGYFPGLYTSLAYWILGPLVLRQLGLRWREVGAFFAIWAIVLLAFAGGLVDLEVLRANP